MVKHLIVLAVVLGCAFASPILEALAEYEERIVGGQNAGQGQYPHQVSLRTRGNHFCGGSIISPNWILTAAHCMSGQTAQSIQVVAGTNTLNSGGLGYSVGRIIVHAQYDPNNNFNDIAVMQVTVPIKYTNVIKPVALANAAAPPGIQLWLSGWGITSYPSNRPPNALQHIGLQAISVAECKQRLPGFPVDIGHQCTSAPSGQGACQGDSGGPLITVDYVQHGVVSWGIPCAKGNPDIFTSVPFYRGWIQGNTGV